MARQPLTRLREELGEHTMPSAAGQAVQLLQCPAAQAGDAPLPMDRHSAGGEAGKAGSNGVYFYLLQSRCPIHPTVKHIIRAVYA